MIHNSVALAASGGGGADYLNSFSFISGTASELWGESHQTILSYDGTEKTDRIKLGDSTYYQYANKLLVPISCGVGISSVKSFVNAAGQTDNSFLVCAEMGKEVINIKEGVTSTGKSQKLVIKTNLSTFGDRRLQLDLTMSYQSDYSEFSMTVTFPSTGYMLYND